MDLWVILLWLLFIGGVILLIGLSVACIRTPEQVWHVAERWKSKDATGPSEKYLRCTRRGGVIMLVLVAICVVCVVVNTVINSIEHARLMEEWRADYERRMAASSYQDPPSAVTDGNLEVYDYDPDTSGE